MGLEKVYQTRHYQVDVTNNMIKISKDGVIDLYRIDEYNEIYTLKTQAYYSLLVHVNKDIFIFVGDCIKKIIIPENFIKIDFKNKCFYSMYPWIRVEYPFEIYHYLIDNNVKILEKRKGKHTDDKFDPYIYYTNNNTITPTRQRREVFMGIIDYRINGKIQNYYYNPDPDKDYDKKLVLAGGDHKKITIKRLNREEEILTKEMNNDIINRFGDTMGISPFDYKKYD